MSFMWRIIQYHMSYNKPLPFQDRTTPLSRGASFIYLFIFCINCVWKRFSWFCLTPLSRRVLIYRERVIIRPLVQCCPGKFFFFGPSFWISLNIFRSMCRTTLIFLPLDRAMSEQHFSYLGHAHICSRKFSRRTWKKVFVKKSTFFKLLSRKFRLFKSLKNKIVRLSEQLLTNYQSHDPNVFTVG